MEVEFKEAGWLDFVNPRGNRGRADDDVLLSSYTLHTGAPLYVNITH